VEHNKSTLRKSKLGKRRHELQQRGREGIEKGVRAGGFVLKTGEQRAEKGGGNNWEKLVERKHREKKEATPEGRCCVFAQCGEPEKNGKISTMNLRREFCAVRLRGEGDKTGSPTKRAESEDAAGKGVMLGGFEKVHKKRQLRSCRARKG